jgi:hypothetical protein
MDAGEMRVAGVEDPRIMADGASSKGGEAEEPPHPNRGKLSGVRSMAGLDR